MIAAAVRAPESPKPNRRNRRDRHSRDRDRLHLLPLARRLAPEGYSTRACFLAPSAGRVHQHGDRAKVDFVIKRNGSAAVHGAATCDSVWICPVCGPRIWRRQREIVVREVTRFAETHFVIMVLGTVPHSLGDALADTQKAVCETMGKTIAAIRRQIKKLGFDIEYLRALEHTHGKHGWHPHIHALILVPRSAYPEGITADEVAEEWRLRWLDTWISKAATGGKKVNEAAIGAQMAASADAAAEYVAKDDLGSAASEIALGQDTKEAGEKSRTPFDILEDVAVADAEKIPAFRDIALWKEYAEATHRVRRITGSRGLRLGLDTWDTSAGDAKDVDEAAELKKAEEEPALVIAHLSKTGFAYASGRGHLPALLHALETAPANRRFRALVEAGVAVGLRREHWSVGPGAWGEDRPCYASVVNAPPPAPGLDLHRAAHAACDAVGGPAAGADRGVWVREYVRVHGSGEPLPVVAPVAEQASTKTGWAAIFDPDAGLYPLHTAYYSRLGISDPDKLVSFYRDALASGDPAGYLDAITAGSSALGAPVHAVA